tara:strand:- start:1226 stop:2359 length:1134 start_codon:yes stop_codon:yes gene_type:complete
MSETIQDKEAQPLKIKKPKKLGENAPGKEYKVDLKNKQEDAIQEQKTNDSDAIVKKDENKESSERVVEEVRPTEEVVKSPITEIENVNKVEHPVIKEPKSLTPVVPENIQKLVDFMKETGGTVQDYARLSTDYSQVDDNTLLKEYYKNTKPHLDQKEIKFIMEDSFKIDEDVDEERDKMKKKLAYKEEIAKAKQFLEDTKNKYYEEIKLRSNVSKENQEAIEFYNKHNKEQEVAQQRRQVFENKTNKLFGEDFKGFEFNVGEKSFNYQIQDAKSISEEQANLSTFIKKFLNKDGEIADANAYHKAIYAARNADTIAKHFYEQGKADAVKDVVAKSKNISADPRPQAGGDIFIGGLRVKAVNGVDSSKLKFKGKKKNN